jgi:hypothetical protein
MPDPSRRTETIHLGMKQRCATIETRESNEEEQWHWKQLTQQLQLQHKMTDPAYSLLDRDLAPEQYAEAVTGRGIERIRIRNTFQTNVKLNNCHHARHVGMGGSE